MQEALQGYHNLDIRAASVFDLAINRSPEGPSGSWGRVEGVKLGMSMLCFGGTRVLISPKTPGKSSSVPKL